MTCFNNHTPINLKAAKVQAIARWDGGRYEGIGYNEFTVFEGKRWHLIHQESSGCEYNGRVDSLCEHLYACETREEMISHLVSREPERWVNQLLTGLGYEGEEA